MRTGLYALGLAAGLYMPSAIATITALVDQRHWGKAIAIHELAPNLAFFTGPLSPNCFLNTPVGERRWPCWDCLRSDHHCLLSLRQGGRFAGESPASNAFGVLVHIAGLLDHVDSLRHGCEFDGRDLCHATAYLVSDRHVEASLGEHGDCVVTLLRPDIRHAWRLGFRSAWTEAHHGCEFDGTGMLTLLFGTVADGWISPVVIIQPRSAVWFFPAGSPLSR